LDAKKVQNLTGIEIWLFLLGRVLVAFAIGVLVTRYFPRLATVFALPALAIGLVFFRNCGKRIMAEDSSG
jgi:hypothetical protein